MIAPDSDLQRSLAAAFDAEMEKALIRGSATATHSARQSAIDKFESLIAVLSGRHRRHCCYVVRPAVVAAMRAACKPSTPSSSFTSASHLMGAPVHEKPDQKADCYAFGNEREAREYLAGHITEDQLANITQST